MAGNVTIKARLLAFLLLTIAGVVGWIAARDLWSAAFCGAANGLFRRLDLGDGGAVYFMPARDPRSSAKTVRDGGYWNSVMWLAHRSSGASIQIPVSPFNLGYAPIALFLAMTLPTVSSRRRWIVAATGGLLALLAIVSLRVYLSILAAATVIPGMGAGLGSGVVKSLIDALINALVHPPGKPMSSP